MMKKDAKPIFDWAKEHGDCAIVERIIVKVLPKFLAHGVVLTAHTVDQMEKIEVPQDLYDDLKKACEALIQQKCNM